MEPWTLEALLSALDYQVETHAKRFGMQPSELLSWLAERAHQRRRKDANWNDLEVVSKRRESNLIQLKQRQTTID